MIHTATACSHMSKYVNLLLHISLHNVYLKPSVISSSMQDFYVAGVSRTLSFNLQNIPKPELFSRAFQGPGKSRKNPGLSARGGNRDITGIRISRCSVPGRVPVIIVILINQLLYNSLHVRPVLLQ